MKGRYANTGARPGRRLEGSSSRTRQPGIGGELLGQTGQRLEGSSSWRVAFLVANELDGSLYEKKARPQCGTQGTESVSLFSQLATLSSV